MYVFLSVVTRNVHPLFKGVSTSTVGSVGEATAELEEVDDTAAEVASDLASASALPLVPVAVVAEVPDFSVGVPLT
jgi:hypothetical protein